MKTANKILILSIIFVIAVLCASCSILGSYNITKVELISTPNDAITSSDNLGNVEVNFYIENRTSPIKASLNLDPLSQSIILNVNGVDLTVNVTYLNNGQPITVCPKTIGTYTITAQFAYNDNDIGTISFTYRVVANEEHAYFAAGTGTSNDPYQITNAQELSNIRYALNKNFKLINDIDLKGIDWIPIGDMKIKSVDGYYQFTFTDVFTGKLDGDGNKIINFEGGNPINCTKNDEYACSLFTAINGGIIKNLELNTNYVDKYNFNVIEYAVSPLAGTSMNALIENVKVSGKIETNSCQASGFIFIAENTTFKDCIYEAELIVKGSSTGSQHGNNVMGGYTVYCRTANTTLTFDHCIFNGTIKHTYHKNSMSAIGQFIGYFCNRDSTGTNDLHLKIDITSRNNYPINGIGDKAMIIGNKDNSAFLGYSYDANGNIDISNQLKSAWDYSKNGTGYIGRNNMNNNYKHVTVEIKK